MTANIKRIGSARAIDRRGAANVGVRLVVLAVALLVPLYAGSSFDLQLADLVVIYGILAVTTRFMMIDAGLLAFSQIGFFAIGSYAALISVQDTGSLWPGFAVAVVGTALLALIVALLSLRLRGFFFAIFTLAFTSLVGLTANQLSFAGGSNGVQIEVPTMAPFGSLGSYDSIYWATVAVAAVVLVILERLGHGPIGLVLRASRDNEAFARGIGLAPLRQRTAAFIYCSVAASIAGVMFGLYFEFISPDSVSLEQVLLVLVMALVGGSGYFWAPFIGAAVFEVVPSLVSVSQSVIWLVAGALMALLVLVAPGGVVGLLVDGYHRLRSVSGGRPQPTEGRVVSAMDEVTRLAGPRLPAPGSGAIGTNAALGSNARSLRAEDIKVSYGGVNALSGVSFEVRGGGEFIGLVGANGSGKTTMVNVLSGFVPATSGRVLLGDTDLRRLPPERRAARGLVRTFQDGAAFRTLDIPECLDTVTVAQSRWALLVRRLRRDGRVDNVPASAISGGARQLLMIAMALARKPDFVILDEPTTALGAEESRQVIALLRQAKASGISAIIIEHHFDVVTELCDRVCVLDHGQLLAEGTPGEVAKNPSVIEAFLGTMGAVYDVGIGVGQLSTDSKLSADTQRGPDSRLTTDGQPKVAP
jgi:branched-chain amino acid transport system permease protein